MNIPHIQCRFRIFDISVSKRNKNNCVLTLKFIFRQSWSPLSWVLLQWERWRLKLILEKTKWYISTRSGRAWDVHQCAYQDYQTFIHIISSDFILTKHSGHVGWTSCAPQRKPTSKQVVLAVRTVPTSEPQPRVTFWPCGWPLSGWPPHWPAQTINPPLGLRLNQNDLL